MSISPALKTDIPALVQLINSAYRGEGAKKGWTTEADLLDGTRTDEANLMDLISDPQTVILKYTDDADKILACVNLQKQDNRLYLGMLTVSPELQGTGIGKKLLVAADDYAREHGCLAVFMTVISVRSELIAWYERHGFHKTGEVKPFPVGEKFGIQKQPLEMIVMEKKLTDVNAR
ncbi:MAG: GNAT family N-acetyltransferase [Bacteroidetes bacterium]|nr:GNAT family N-acetyltransferase [Bacteroidota bacterium]